MPSVYVSHSVLSRAVAGAIALADAVATVVDDVSLVVSAPLLVAADDVVMKTEDVDMPRRVDDAADCGCGKSGEGAVAAVPLALLCSVSVVCIFPEVLPVREF